MEAQEEVGREVAARAEAQEKEVEAAATPADWAAGAGMPQVTGAAQESMETLD